MKAFRDAALLAALIFLSAHIAADAEVSSAHDLGAGMWRNAQQVCPREANSYDEYFPDSIQRIIQKQADGSETEAQSLSPEAMQIVVYTVVQAAQLGTLLSYQAELQGAVGRQEQPDLRLRQKAQVATDFAKCLMPVGARFSASSEPGVSELAHVVTKDVICKKWNEYSDRLLVLNVSELTPDALEKIIKQIGNEAVLCCQSP